MGIRALKFQVVCPQNGTAVLNGLRIAGSHVFFLPNCDASTSIQARLRVIKQKKNDPDSTATAVVSLVASFLLSAAPSHRSCPALPSGPAHAVHEELRSRREGVVDDVVE